MKKNEVFRMFMKPFIAKPYDEVENDKNARNE